MWCNRKINDSKIGKVWTTLPSFLIEERTRSIGKTFWSGFNKMTTNDDKDDDDDDESDDNDNAMERK